MVTIAQCKEILFVRAAVCCAIKDVKIERQISSLFKPSAAKTTLLIDQLYSHYQQITTTNNVRL